MTDLCLFTDNDAIQMMLRRIKYRQKSWNAKAEFVKPEKLIKTDE